MGGGGREKANGEQVTTVYNLEKPIDHASELSHQGMGQLGYLSNYYHPAVGTET